MVLSKQLKSEVSYHTFRFTASRMPPGSNRTASWAAISLYRLLPVTGTAPSRRTRSGNPDSGKSTKESAQCTDMYTCSSLAFPCLPLLLFRCTWTLSLLIFFFFFFLLGGRGIGQYVYQKFYSSIIFALWHTNTLHSIRMTILKWLQLSYVDSAMPYHTEVLDRSKSLGSYKEVWSAEIPVMMRAGWAKLRIITFWSSRNSFKRMPRSNPTNVWLQMKRIGCSFVIRGTPLFIFPFSSTVRNTGLKSSFIILCMSKEKKKLHFCAISL